MSNELTWFKSSYSNSEGGECVEIALPWQTSSHSNSEGGNCVEVATDPGAVHVRDSKDPGGPQLLFAPEAWIAFVAHVRAIGVNTP